MALEDYGVITGIMPEKEGWRYEQEWEGGKQRIPPKGCAGTGKRLVEMVKKFRINIHVDVGNVEEDVANYIKSVSQINNRFPRKQFFNSNPEPVKKKKSIQSRIRDWLRKIMPTHPRLLMEDEAIARSEICSKCRANVKWSDGCVPCAKEIYSMAQNVRQRPSFEPSDNLKACVLHDIYLPAAVFIDSDHLPARHPSAPEFCWMQKPPLT